MNILTKALNDVKFSIPFEVLRVAFRDEFANWRNAPVSLDTQIMDKVIKPRVLIDCNLVGGTQAIVNLEGLPSRFVDNFSYIYVIPPDRVANKEILSILSVGYLPHAGSFGFGSGMHTLGPPTGSSDFTTAGQRVMDSVSSMPVVSSASCDLIGYNTVIIRDSQRLSATYNLRCVLANDENLSNINPRSHLAFTMLCTLAVKSYIYNKLIIAMDQAFLSGGQELGSMKNYIEGLADSEQMYRDYITNVWRDVAFHNDHQSLERFIRIQISPGL
jgi:hypothetical protein